MESLIVVMVATRPLMQLNVVSISTSHKRVIRFITFSVVVSNNGCDVENGGCAQLCNVTGGDNTVYCSCTEGYILSSDGRSCSGKGQ